MKTIIRFTLLIILVIAAGCSGIIMFKPDGPAFSKFEAPGDSDSVLYVYRPPLHAGSAVSPAVYINDELKPALKNAGYQVYILAPGVYTITLKGSFTKQSATVDMLSSRTYFLRYGSLPETGMTEKFMNSLAGRKGNPVVFVEVIESLAKEELPNTWKSM